MNDLEESEWSEDEENGNDQAQQESSGSEEGIGARLWFFSGLALLVILLAVCGWVAVVLLWFGKTIVAEPTEVRVRANTIADLNLPPQWKPDRAMRVRTPFERQPALEWARFVDPDETISLVLAQSADPFSPQLETSLLRASVEQSLGKLDIATRHVVPENSFTRKVTIRGQAVTFTCLVGKDPKTRSPAIEVVGLFPGKRAAALLLIYARADKHSREQLFNIVDSIR